MRGEYMCRIKDRLYVVIIYTLFSAWAQILLLKPCYALPEDGKQVLTLAANSADISQTLHQGTYDGDVALDQGTTHIRADKATTLMDEKNKLTKAMIYGKAENQAHYWVLMDASKPMVHAYADTIEYIPEKHLIKLIGHARVEQGKNSFSAPVITYDTESQQVTTEHKPNERTTIVYYPAEGNS